MRLFVAVDLDPSLLDRLDAYVRALQPHVSGVRFVRRETYHITLKFLGEVAAAEPLIERLGNIRQTEFALRLAGTGFFPDSRAARVFWAGVVSHDLAALANEVDRALEPLGFLAQEEFHPHLTLARNGSGRPRRGEPAGGKSAGGEPANKAFAQLVRRVASSEPPEFGTMTAREFFLYESRLSPAGASYTKLARFALSHAG